MQIDFGLPNGAGGMAAAHSAAKLKKDLAQWQEHYNIALCIRSSTHSHRHWIQVEFYNDRDFTLFALTWTAQTFMPWQIGLKVI